ncbi:response regulator [Altererythrobacter aurantiacus]|uniref:Response regulator n=1 Tax=Parapontixanthobacter aurantiacus TaxID=1463599 RepID=A0A844ZFX7_9SPHN|nr:response regulator [Parapontixanthobacter aurantiacus]
MNILIVDDEPSIIRALKPVLTALSHDVFEAATGSAALQMVRQSTIDIVLLDLGLPDADGSELIAPLKDEAGASVLVLSARHLEADKVRALDEGADDYIDKPFGMAELLARIRVIERRRKQESDGTATIFQSENLRVDLARRQVTLMGEPINLSPKEFAIFGALVRNSAQVVTQRQLMIAGWNTPLVDGQYLRSYIALLRDKLEEDPSYPELILTESGVGYRLAEQMTPVRRT